MIWEVIKSQLSGGIVAACLNILPLQTLSFNPSSGQPLPNAGGRGLFYRQQLKSTTLTFPPSFCPSLDLFFIVPVLSFLSLQQCAKQELQASESSQGFFWYSPAMGSPGEKAPYHQILFLHKDLPSGLKDTDFFHPKTGRNGMRKLFPFSPDP